ncbi:MAG: DUF4214 domain-containing protein [Cellulomonadaceae bacterium]|nr:DUF4214 domain-containing protein [Cellulomonadaceae bacterium]
MSPHMAHRLRRTAALGTLAAVLAVGSVAGTVSAATPSSGAVAAFTRTYASVAPGTIGAYYTDRYGAAHNGYSSPAVGDVTGDGVLDLVAGQANGYVYVYRASDGAFQRRIQVDPTPGTVISSPTLVDLNGDGRLDIVAGFMPQNEGAATRTIGGFDGATGGVLFSKKTCTWAGAPCNVFSTIAVGDVDGDGAPDLVATSQDHYLHAWHTNGTYLAGFPVRVYDTTWSSPSIVDLDRDGTAEIVVIPDLDSNVCEQSPAGCSPGQYGSIVRVVESNGVISANRVIQGEITISSPAVGDITGDGYPEIVFTSGSCFRYQTGCGAGSPPSYGAERLLHVLDRNLNDVFTPRALKNAAQTSPALLNVNGGSGEIAVTDNEGWLYLYDTSGNQVWSTCGRSSTSACRTGIYGTTPSIGTDASPVVGDVDNDGKPEIVFQGEAVLRVYDAATGAVEYAHTLYGDPLPVGNQVSSPTIFTMGGVTRIAYHVLFEANGNGARDGGDRDGMFLFTSTASGVGAYSWPAFRGNATDRHGSMGALPRIDHASTPEGRFIAKAYVDLLGRSVDAGGLRYWYTVVRSSGRASFARQTVYASPSCEWARTVVAGYYTSILGRAPDNTGSEAWTQDLCNRRRLARDVAAFFYGLPEYYNSHGGTPESFVDAVYPAIMGRSPDAGGRAYWISQVRASGSTAVAATLYQQQEPREFRVKGQYVYLLGREPDAAGRRYWASRLLYQDDLELTIDLVSSQEYYQTP